MTTKIILPEMGEGVIEGTLSRWLVQEGDTVQQYDPVAEIETDKVTTEIATEVAGTVLKLIVNEGDTIPVDTVLAHIGELGEKISSDQPEIGTAAPSNVQTSAPTSLSPQSPLEDQSASAKYTGRISPVVGRIAAENDVDLGLVQGTGRDGRVTKHDIMAYIELCKTIPPTEPREAVPVDPQIELAPDFPPENIISDPHVDQPHLHEKIPMTSMRRAIADHMVLSKRTSPHVTTVFEFDFTAVTAHRALNKEAYARDGANLTFTVYITAATVRALKQHPLANSVWSDDGILLQREINIGLAAAVPGGLAVPVIKGADGMNLLGLARIINDLTYRARTKRLTHDHLQGGTFSITNHGTSGSLFATPIINQPQAGILGVGKIEKRVKVINDAIAIRPLAYASFTFDHRILDGATADAFVSTIKDIIENWS